MPHPALLSAFHSTSSFAALAERLPRAGESVVASGLVGSSPAVLVGALHRAKPERIWVVVTSGPDAAEHMIADLESLLGEGQALVYPQRESLPYEEAETHVEIGGLRVEALEALLTGRAPILVTTHRAIQERSLAVDRLQEMQLELRAGADFRPAEVIERLEAMGFERVPTVEEIGQFASRGGILDVFGFGTPEPARVEFWGDTIESIRRFDVLTQLSVGPLDNLRILPVDVRFAPRQTTGRGNAAPRTLLSYLPDEAVVLDAAGGSALADWERTWTEVQRLHAGEVAAGNRPDGPETLFSPRRRSPPKSADSPVSSSGARALRRRLRSFTSACAPRRSSSATCPSSERYCGRGQGGANGP